MPLKSMLAQKLWRLGELPCFLGSVGETEGDLAVSYQQAAQLSKIGCMTTPANPDNIGCSSLLNGSAAPHGQGSVVTGGKGYERFA